MICRTVGKLFLVGGMAASGVVVSTGVGAAPTEEITIEIAYDGLSPFDGADATEDNGIVRSGDDTGLTVNWNINEEDVAEAIVELDVPAPSGWSPTLPAPCLTTGVATPSEVIVGAVTSTLRCNLGPQSEGSNGAFPAVMIAGSLESGTRVPMVARFGAATSNTVDVEVVSQPGSFTLGKSLRQEPQPGDIRGQWEPNTIYTNVDSGGELGMIVMFPVMISNAGPLKGSGPLDDSVPIQFVDYLGNLGVPNARLATAGDMTAAGLAGKTPCGPVDTFIEGAPFGAPGITPDATVENSATGSGVWSCNFTGSIGSGGTGLVEVEITGQNSATAQLPLSDTEGASLANYYTGQGTPAAPITRSARVFASGQIAVFIPETDIEDRLGVPTSGTIVGWNQLAGSWVDDDLDMLVTTSDALPNGDDELKPWTHPLPDSTIMVDPFTGGIPANNISTDEAADDFMRLRITRSNSGGYTYYYHNYYQQISRSVGNYAFTSYDSRGLTLSNGHTIYIPTQTQDGGNYAGDGTVVPGQPFTAFQMKSRATSLVAENFVMCQMFDTRVISIIDNQPFELHDATADDPITGSFTVEPGESGRAVRVLGYTGEPISAQGNALALVEGVDYVIEYSDVPVQASEGTAGATPGMSGGAPGSGWNAVTSCDDDLDGDTVNDWTTDLTDARFGATAQTGDLFGDEYPNATRVRIRSLRAQEPTERWEFHTSLKADPEPGFTALGTLLPSSANFARWPEGVAWTGTAGDGTVGAYQTNTYDAVVHCTNRTTPECPNDGTNSSAGDRGYGDRTALGPAFMTLSKVVSSGQDTDLRIGDEVTYSITAQIYDDPALGANDVSVVDTLPTGMSFVNATPAPTSVVGNVVTWDRATVNTIYRETFEIVARIDEGDSLERFRNTVTLDAERFDDTPFAQRSARDDVRLGLPYDEYGIVKSSAQRYVAPGSGITYDLTYTNEAVRPLDAPVIIDVLPWVGDDAVPPTNVAWPFPISSTAPPSGTTLSPGDGRVPASSFGGSIDFVSAVGPNGETFEYTSALPSSISADPLDPSNLPLGSTVWCSALSGPGCPTTESEVTALRITADSDLAGGESRTVTVNVATVDNSCDDLYTNNFGSRTGSLLLPVRSNDVTAVVEWCPAIDLEKSTNTADADSPTGPLVGTGGAVTWTYTVTNTGDTPLANVTVVDVPAQTIDCGDGTNVIAVMLPDDEIECTATGTATIGQYTNEATVTGTPVVPPEADGVDPNDPGTWPDPSEFVTLVDPTSSEAVDPVEADDPSHYFGGTPAVIIDKQICTLDVAADCDPADDSLWAETHQLSNSGPAVWRIVVTNTGDIDLNPVEVTDTLEPACDRSLGQLAPAATVTYTCETAEVTESFTNEAAVSGTPSTPDGTGLVDPETGETLEPVTDDDLADVVASAQVTVSKSVSTSTVEPGGTVDWVLVASNIGGGPATDVVVTDTLPEGLELAATPAGADYDPSTRVITWDLGTLAAGEEVDLGYATTVDAEDGTELENIVVIETSSPGDVLSDNEDIESVSVEEPPPATTTPPPPTTMPNIPLPETGSDGPGSLLPIGLAALLLGLVFVIGARRRSPRVEVS